MASRLPWFSLRECTDDRARPCELLKPIARTPFHLPWQGWAAPRGLRRARIIAWAGIGIGAALFWWSGTHFDPVSELALPAAYFIVAVTTGRYWLIDFKQGRRFRAQQHAAAGFCPCCDYDFSTVPDADDGCTVCPECGSAWRQ